MTAPIEEGFMCARFALHSDMASIRGRFGVRSNVRSEWSPRWNMKTGDNAPIIRRGKNSRREIAILKWGLELDHPLLETEGGPATTLAARSLKRGALLNALFETNRCIVPLDAFYVTPPFASKAHTWAFAQDDEATMGAAAIWVPDPDPNKTGHFAIILTSPNESVALLDESMPAVLFPEQEREWLSVNTPPDAAYHLIKPYPADLMRAWPVARLSGEGPGLLARVA
jgi:putative SOS response-associated peptidase YedK